MTKVFCFCLLVLTSTAFGDIPRPPRHQSVDVTVNGKDAVELYDSLNAKELMGSSLRTSSSSYKVFRSTTGATQVVCEKTVSRFGETKVSGTCTISQSTNGQPLPVFKPRIRMG